MTTHQLCKAIYQAMEYLPDNFQQDTQRVYEKTWSIVSLDHEGLTKPTEAARGRLEDLWNVVEKERTRRLEESIRKHMEAQIASGVKLF